MVFNNLSGDDLTVALFFAAAGVTFMTAGLQERGFKRWGLVLAGLVSFCCAVFWPLLKDFSPIFSGAVVKTASHPASWFSYGIHTFDWAADCAARAKPAAMAANCAHPARIVLGPGGL